MAEAYVLGIDNGTSVVKSVIFDLRGNEVAVSRRQVPLLHRIANGSEVDMDVVWTLTAETIAEVIGQVGADTIIGVGGCGTACGVWAIDMDNRPVREALLWNDGRASPIIDSWQTDGFFSHAFAVSGNAAFPGYPLSALTWLAHNEPHTLERARWLLFNKDWVRFCLTGVVMSDESDVGYFPGNLHARTYDRQLMQQAGIDFLWDKLPAVTPSAEIVGTVTARASQQTGLREGTPVVAGAVDVVASLLGGGASRVGQACSVLGTSFLNTLVLDAPSFDPPDIGVQTCMPQRRWARSLVNTSGTLCMDWMLEICTDASQRGQPIASQFALIEAEAKAIAIGADGLLFLPYLSSAGVISPFSSANARGMFFGITREHTRAHMARAIYEGVALSMRDCYAHIAQPLEEVLLVGGGARSAFWAQMFADCTGKRIIVPEGSEFGARGAAILAAVGVGRFVSVDDAVDTMVRPSRIYHPQAANTARYDALYTLYTHLHQNAHEAWALRMEMMDTLSTLSQF